MEISFSWSSSRFGGRSSSDSTVVLLLGLTYWHQLVLFSFPAHAANRWLLLDDRHKLLDILAKQGWQMADRLRLILCLGVLCLHIAQQELLEHGRFQMARNSLIFH